MSEPLPSQQPALPVQGRLPGETGGAPASPSWVAFALVSLPALAYCALLAATAVNVPYLDDYDTVLRFLLETREEPSEALNLLVAQHVEHRLVFLRAVTLAVVGATGHVNFVALAWIGCLGLALLAAGLFIAWRPGVAPRDKLLGFAPVTLLLFQPQSWDALFWATSALSNLWVLPLALATLIALRREGPRAMASAAALATVAALTQGNGLLILPAGLLLLCLQRRPGSALIWGALSALGGALYALDFRPVEGVPELLDSLQRAPELFHYGLNFLGSAAGFSHPVRSPLVGALLLCSAAALWVAGFPKQNPVLYTLLLLLAVSAGVNALARAHISGAEYALGSVRYRFYSSATLAVSYLCWAEWIATRLSRAEQSSPADALQRSRTGRLARGYLAASLAGALIFGAVSYGLYTQKALKTSRQLRGGLEHFRSTGRGLRHPDVPRAGALLTRAIEQELYSPEL